MVLLFVCLFFGFRLGGLLFEGEEHGDGKWIGGFLFDLRDG